jgi:hypothetical protein
LFEFWGAKQSAAGRVPLEDHRGLIQFQITISLGVAKQCISAHMLKSQHMETNFIQSQRMPAAIIF